MPIVECNECSCGLTFFDTNNIPAVIRCSHCRCICATVELEDCAEWVNLPGVDPDVTEPSARLVHYDADGRVS